MIGMKTFCTALLLTSGISSYAFAYTSACIPRTVVSAQCDERPGLFTRVDVVEQVQNPRFADSLDPSRICKSKN